MVVVRIFGWAALATALALSTVAMNRLQADPSDDFSFASFQFDPGLLIESPLKESHIAEIFEDRLDLYPRAQMQSLARHFVKLCRTHQYDPAFILSLIHVESSFRVKALSPVGARGLMQVMPATAQVVAKRLGIRLTSPEALFDPATNLTLGVTYLSMLREKYRGMSPYFHIAAYNIGPGRLDQLLNRPEGFRPTQTKVYYERIRAGVADIRFYVKPEKIQVTSQETSSAVGA